MRDWRPSRYISTMSAEAIDYVKKPAMEFLRDSWRLVKRCTKPDRTGVYAFRLPRALKTAGFSNLLSLIVLADRT